MSRVHILYDKDIAEDQKGIIGVHDKAVISAAASSVQLRWTKHYDAKGRELFRLVEHNRPDFCLCELAFDEINTIDTTELKRIIITKERSIRL